MKLFRKMSLLIPLVMVTSKKTYEATRQELRSLFRYTDNNPEQIFNDLEVISQLYVSNQSEAVTTFREMPKGALLHIHTDQALSAQGVEALCDKHFGTANADLAQKYSLKISKLKNNSKEKIERIQAKLLEEFQKLGKNKNISGMLSAAVNLFLDKECDPSVFKKEFEKFFNEFGLSAKDKEDSAHSEYKEKGKTTQQQLETQKHTNAQVKKEENLHAIKAKAEKNKLGLTFKKFYDDLCQCDINELYSNYEYIEKFKKKLKESLSCLQLLKAPQKRVWLEVF